MAAHPLTDEDLQRSIKVGEECGWNRTHAAERLGISPRTLMHRWKEAQKRGFIKSIPKSTSVKAAPAFKGGEPLEFPEFPNPELPANELLDLVKGEFRREFLASRARKWAEIGVNIAGPIGIMWFGDPHVDSPGCNWPLLDEHARICCETEGMFGANIGDTTDNWVGRLARLYAHSNTSRTRAVRLAEIFISEMGIDWLLILRGNHDMWSKSSKDDPLTWFRRGGMMEDWQMKFQLAFPGGRTARIWAAHDFPGHSIHNPTHGAKRASYRDSAHLYICGHKHNWALHAEENPDTGMVSWFARARGYKFIDHFGENLGHEAQMEGAAITTIIDPQSVSESGFIQCFSDPGQAAEFLTWKRKKAA